jgi:hypothetical protein
MDARALPHGGLQRPVRVNNPGFFNILHPQKLWKTLWKPRD